jgi:hypothetical protein
MAAPVASGAVAPATVIPKCPPCPGGGGGGGGEDPDKGKNGHGEHHGGTGDTSPDTSGTPDTPTAPTAPTAPAKPAAPADALKDAKGQVTNNELEEERLAGKVVALAWLVQRRATMELFCSLALVYNFADSQKPDILAAGLYFAKGCQGAISAAAKYEQVVRDPPDARFLEVALPTALALPGASIRCGSRVSTSACANLNAGFSRYAAASSAANAATDGLAASLNRLASAVAAGSAEGKQIQAGAAAAYGGQLAAALTSLIAAGRSVAALLQASRIDIRLDRNKRQALVKRLASPTGLPASIVRYLLATGAATSCSY